MFSKSVDSSTTDITPRPKSLFQGAGAQLGDRVFRLLATAFGLLVFVLILWIGYGLFRESSISRARFGWSMLTSSAWDVPHEAFGALPFIYGTIVTSVIALIVAVPIGIGAALFLTEIAPRWLAVPVSFIVELIAAIPSVIFGLWGFLVVCPWLNERVYPWLTSHFGSVPLFSGPASPVNVLAAGLILAIMVLPFITAVSRDVIKTVPASQREAALGLGATKWETVRTVVLRGAKSGIIGAIILALGRAIGETMAVVMVIGNNPQITKSILQPGYTMPSLLANQFNEAAGEPLQRSALLEIAFILFVITLVVNGFARLLILLSARGPSGGHSAPENPKLERAREVAGRAVRLGGAVLLLAVVVLQTAADLKTSGLAGLMGPVEVLAAAYVISRVVTARARGTRLWTPWRRLNHATMYAIFSACAAAACLLLVLLLYYVSAQGLRSLGPSFFLNDATRAPDDPTSGFKNGILGTLLLVGLGGCIGIPSGVLGGIYLSEFGQGRLGGLVRFAADVLSGIPSVVIGMFAYAVFVLPVGHFSAAAGGAALGIMMVPIIMRTTEEMLKQVPVSLREGSLGLGATKTRTIRSVVLPAARAGIVTGILLATARIAGETAPLLFTAFGNPYVSTKLSEPVHSMTMMIYRYATSASQVWIDLAWAGAFVLLVLVLVLNIIARLATRSRYAMR